MARILLCVGGGISAYKAPALVRALVRASHEVQVLMTEAAGAFVTEMALTTVSKRPVRRTLLDAAAEGSVGHIDLADWADHVLVAPATANLMARAALGLANDLVSTVLLATQAPLSFAPAMNTNMWRHPATQANVATLVERGAQIIGPDAGDLACGWTGEGRMMDPDAIVGALHEHMEAGAPGHKGVAPSWQGRHLLVSAGPTRAYLDPVRFVSNASTGAMGVAIAQAALDAGARVTLVAGPLQVAGPQQSAGPGASRLVRVDVDTASQMLDAMQECLRVQTPDAVAMVAAVADFAPQAAGSQKLGKQEALAAFSDIQWMREPDILATLAQEFRDDAFFLGFAAQTVAEQGDAGRDALLTYARAKLESKHAHAIFANRVGEPGLGFGSPTNAGWWVQAEGEQTSGSKQPKADLGRWICARMLRAMDESATDSE